MKINNKLFLITATLGLMAAGSATAFASHSNYVYVTNNTTHSATVTESWQSGGHHMHFYNGSNHHSYSPLTMNIAPGEKTTFRQDENSRWSESHEGTVLSFTGDGLFTFQLSGTNLNDGVVVQYHALYRTHGDTMPAFYCQWNRLDSANITNENGTISTNVFVGNSDTALNDEVNTTVTCIDQTHLYINIGYPNTSRTFSPMGKLSSMLQSFKL